MIFLPAVCPGCHSVRPSGWEDETHGQQVRGYIEIPLLFSLLGHIWSEGFTTAGRTQCFLFRDLQGLVGFTAVRHPFTRKRSLCGHAKGHPGQGSGSGTLAGDPAWDAGRAGPGSVHVLDMEGHCPPEMRTEGRGLAPGSAWLGSACGAELGLRDWKLWQTQT